MLSVLEVTQRVPPTCTRLHVPLRDGGGQQATAGIVLNATELSPLGVFAGHFMHQTPKPYVLVQFGRGPYLHVTSKKKA